MSTSKKCVAGQRSSNFSGFTLFTEEFYNANRNKLKSMEHGGRAMRKAWHDLEESEKSEYHKRAKELRQAPKEHKYVVPFYTRCAPKQFMDVCNKLKNRKDIMDRLRAIGFDKLVDICCPQIQRDLCQQFMHAFDPPTRTISIRGKKQQIVPKDVNVLLRLPCGGRKIEATVNKEDKVYNDLRKVYGKVPYKTIASWLVEEKVGENFEFLFVLYALGTLLCPSSTVYVNDKLLKVMALTQDGFGKFDWCSYVVEELCTSIREYQQAMKKGSTTKNVGGCLYFLMIYCLQMFPMMNEKASQLKDAISYWTEERVKARAKLEKDSNQGVLHGRSSTYAPTSTNFNPQTDLTHPEIKRTYTRLVSMIGEELYALQSRLFDGGHEDDDDVENQQNDADNIEDDVENEDDDDAKKDDDSDDAEKDDEDEDEEEDEEEDEDEDEEEDDGEKEDNADNDDEDDDEAEEKGAEGNEGGHHDDINKEDKGGNKRKGDEGDKQIRRSTRTRTAAIKSPFVVDKKGKKREYTASKEDLFQLCTSVCHDDEGNE